MKSILSVVLFFLALSACQSNQSSKPMSQTESSIHEVVIKEVIQVSGYTYLFVQEKRMERWLATPPIQAKEGETYYYEGGFEMVNFKSKELDRTFESIIFLEGISTSPTLADGSETLVSPGATTIKEGKKEIQITPAEGCITISELFSNKESYEGKMVKIKAEVTKFSPEIMETNWIHLQDGTDFEGDFDLTVTSPEIVAVGNVVIFEGKITLDKDLGFGYFFPVLMENASLVK